MPLKAKPPQEVKPGHLKAVIFGASGVGKTWLSLMFPKPYYLDSEGGSKLAHYQNRLKEVGGVYFGPEDGAGDFPTIIEEVRALSSERHDYKTLVIDSATKPFNTLIGREAERLGAKDSFGASKKPAIAAVRSLIHAIDKLDMNVIIICHEKPKWSNGEQIGFEEDIWDKLRYETDLTLRLIKVGTQRKAVVCKSRLTGFPDGASFEASMDEFETRYGKDYIQAPAVPVALATKEQVEEINRLLGIVKIAQEDIDKWHTKAKAESFADYRFDDLEKLIKHLKQKAS